MLVFRPSKGLWALRVVSGRYLGNSMPRYLSAMAPEKENTPKSWWVTCDSDMGMNVLSGKGCTYVPAEYPILVLGPTFLAVRDDGKSSWGNGVPKELDDKLRGKQNSLPRPNLICLGQDGDSAEKSKPWQQVSLPIHTTAETHLAMKFIVDYPTDWMMQFVEGKSLFHLSAVSTLDPTKNGL